MLLLSKYIVKQMYFVM